MSSVSLLRFLLASEANVDETTGENVSGQTFVCLQYPGIVQNNEKAYETLGGLEEISQAHFKKRHLRLTYRPDNVYRKPVLGHRSSGFFVVIKVTRKKRKSTQSASESSAQFSCTTEVLGTVTSLYHFRGMCDLQYDPMRRKPDGTYESIYDLVIPKDFATAVTWFDKEEPNESESVDGAVAATSVESPTPLFLPPQCFSRFHFTSQLLLSKETTYRETSKNELRKAADSVGVSLRTERRSHTIMVTATQSVYPSAPIDEAVKFADSRYPGHSAHTDIRQLFEERPMWGRTAITCRTGFSESCLKVFLPKFAFYVKTGPFGRLWCRFGYDPRKDPDSKRYQVIQINFGKKSDPNVREFVRLRRLHQYRIRRVAQGGSSKSHAEDTPEQAMTLEYDFKPGRIPTQRQVYYQLCDIHIPEAQQLVLDTSHKPICHPQSGWFSAHRLDAVRQAIAKDVELTVAKLVQEKDDLNETFYDLSESDESSVDDEGDSTD